MLTADECITYKQFVDKYQWYIYPLFSSKIARMYGRYGGRIIDLGTGPGYLSAELARRTEATVYAVDINPAMHALARERVTRLGLENLIQFDLADVHNLPYPDNFADLVVSYSCLHHWVNPIRGLAECYRVLSVGGQMVIVDTVPNTGSALDMLRQTIVEPEYIKIVEKAFAESYTEAQVIQMAAAAGLQNYQVKMLNFDEEDILECLDVLDDLPFENSDSSEASLCWILEAQKSATTDETIIVDALEKNLV